MKISHVVAIVMTQKPFWAHLPQIYILGPSPHVRLNFQKKGVGHKILNKMKGIFENLASGCQVMPKKQFWACLPEISILGPSPFGGLNFQLKKKSSLSIKF